MTVTGGENFGAVCLKVSATANNPTKKPVYNADVFGRVYDANGEACIDDVSEATWYRKTCMPLHPQHALSLLCAVATDREHTHRVH